MNREKVLRSKAQVLGNHLELRVFKTGVRPVILDKKGRTVMVLPASDLGVVKC